MNEVRLAFRDATAKSRITVGIKEPRAQTRGAARDSRLSHRATRRSACRLLDANPPASTQMATLAAEQQRPGGRGSLIPWNEVKRVVCDGAECRARTEAGAAPDSPAPPHRQEHNASRQGSAPLRSRRRLPCSPRQEGRGVADRCPYDNEGSSASAVASRPESVALSRLTGPRATVARWPLPSNFGSAGASRESSLSCLRLVRTG